MRAIDADAIVVHKFPSEDYDPSENDAEKAYRKGWNDALDAVAEFQPSVEPEETLEEAEEGIDAAFKRLRDARVTIQPSAEPELATNLQQSCNQLATDTISRQAAIEEFVMTAPQMSVIHIYEAVEILESMPSAEPEIIRCRECKHMQEDKLFGQYWCRGNEVKPDHFCGYAERRADE